MHLKNNFKIKVKKRFTLLFSPRFAVGIGVNISDEDCSECSAI